jgi:hypothetical protein
MTYGDFLSLQQVLELIKLVGQGGAGGLDEVSLGVVVGSFHDQLSVLVQPGIDFTNILRKAFTNADPKRAKRLKA